LDGQVFLSMEFIDGEDLGSLLRRIGRLPADKAPEIARQPSCTSLRPRRTFGERRFGLLFSWFSFSG
jgi:hypothetical protein